MDMITMIMIMMVMTEGNDEERDDDHEARCFVTKAKGQKRSVFTFAYYFLILDYSLFVLYFGLHIT